MDPATATAATAHARRRSSISDYSSLFSNAQPKAASFINKTRHPSLTMSMKGERPPGFSALQRAMGKSGDEQAIVDDESTAAGSSNGSEQGEGTGHRRALTDDPVGLGRRLSQGARAIMYSGNRLKGDGVTLKRTPSSATSPTLNDEEFSELAATPAAPAAAAAAGKQIRRKMSPTGERMLRGELQM